jgi:hypothetical protein
MQCIIVAVVFADMRCVKNCMRDTHRKGVCSGCTVTGEHRTSVVEG